MIKRVFVLLALSVLVLQFAFSQIKPFRFGLKVAPNVGWISPDSDGYEKNGTSAGFSWGFIGDFSITENYFFSSGFNVTYINGNISQPHTEAIINNGDTTKYTGTLQRKIKFRYIDLPLTLKMKTNKFDAIQVYGQIGFSVGFNLKAKSDETFSYKVGSEYMSTNNTSDISDEITLVKGSLVLGGGMEYFIDNSTSIVAGITYYNGLSNIMKGYNTAYPSTKQKTFASYFELTIGIIF